MCDFLWFCRGTVTVISINIYIRNWVCVTAKILFYLSYYILEHARDKRYLDELLLQMLCVLFLVFFVGFWFSLLV